MSDAGDGAGTWTVEVRPQSQPSGVEIVVPGAITLAPGGFLQVPVTARAAGDAGTGEAYGFLLLRRGDVTRKVPYAMLVTRPGLAQVPIVPLSQFQTGDTRKGVSRASVYRYPAAAFGPAPSYVGAPVNEDGAEQLYRIRLDEPAVNVGAAVVVSSPGSLIHPWVLGSPDENDVQGYAGTPVNVNNLTVDYPLDIGAAATVFPRTKAYYVAVDSGRDQFTGRSLGGQYVLRAWVDDLQPPLLGLITSRVAAGRPTIALRVLDLGAGVDPYSLVIGYGRALIGAAGVRPRQRDRALPAADGGAGAEGREAAAERLRRRLPGGEERRLRRRRAAARTPPSPPATSPSSTARPSPGSRPRRTSARAAQTPLVVLASSTAALRSVRFFDGRKLLATDKQGGAGLFSAVWRRGGAAKGKHTLRAIVTDAKGRKAEAQRVVRVCP